MGKYDDYFNDVAFQDARGQFLEPEDKKICSCDNNDLLYCYVHKIHYSIINGKKTAVESSKIVVL